MEILKYVNDDENAWVVHVGVLQGASLWKVGNSVEQNGYFNASFTKAKSKMIALKYFISMNLKLVPTDAMILIK